jgi:hypothetical protein
MLALAHRCSAHIIPSRTFTLALLGRCFSLTHRRPEATSAPSALDHVKDAKPREDPNVASKIRYANDPEYRAKILARSNARNRDLYANDP